MLRTLLLTAALVGAGLTQVEAGHGHSNHGGHHHHNHGGIGYGGYRGYGSSFRYGGAGYGYGYGVPSYGGAYHDTSHWDYHPTTIVPHRNHYHVVPGHYDWHNTGHYHY